MSKLRIALAWIIVILTFLLILGGMIIAVAEGAISWKGPALVIFFFVFLWALFEILDKE